MYYKNITKVKISIFPKENIEGKPGTAWYAPNAAFVKSIKQRKHKREYKHLSLNLNSRNILQTEHF